MGLQLAACRRQLHRVRAVHVSSGVPQGSKVPPNNLAHEPQDVPYVLANFQRLGKELALIEWRYGSEPIQAQDYWDVLDDVAGQERFHPLAESLVEVDGGVSWRLRASLHPHAKQ